MEVMEEHCRSYCADCTCPSGSSLISTFLLWSTTRGHTALEDIWPME